MHSWSVIQHFKRSDTHVRCNRTVFNFYMRISYHSTHLANCLATNKSLVSYLLSLIPRPRLPIHWLLVPGNTTVLWYVITAVGNNPIWSFHGNSEARHTTYLGDHQFDNDTWAKKHKLTMTPTTACPWLSHNIVKLTRNPPAGWPRIPT